MINLQDEDITIESPAGAPFYIYFMKTLENKNIIIEKLDKVSTVDDLAALLQFIYLSKVKQVRSNLSKNKKEPEKILIKPSHLNYFAFILKDGEAYKPFSLIKKNGQKRQINAPRFTLKIIQRCLLEIFSCSYDAHKAAHGFVRGKSIVSNCRRHVGQMYVYNIDIKDFFPSTSFGRVRKILTFPPFNLNGKREKIATLIASLCCCKGFLPQGGVTSPILTNIICRRLDAKLSQLAKLHRLQYSRYADDITFSSNKIEIVDEILIQIKAIIAAEGYEINPEKERMQSKNQRQLVTGLVVNTKINVKRDYVNDIRFYLNLWKKYGRESAQAKYLERIFESTKYKRGKSENVKIENHLSGKIEFLKMVKGLNDPIYIKLNEQFNSLISDNTPIEVKNRQDNISLVLDLWENDGFEAAMNMYKKLF